MNSQDQKKNQNQDQKSRNQQQSAQSQKPQDSKKKGAQEMSEEDEKNVQGGSGLLSGGNDLTNVIQGGIGISNSSSGSDGTHSYNSQDSHQVNLGLGNMLDNTNF